MRALSRPARSLVMGGSGYGRERQVSEPRAQTQTCLSASSHMTEHFLLRTQRDFLQNPPLAGSSAAVLASENLPLSLACARAQVRCPGHRCARSVRAQQLHGAAFHS